MNHWLINNRLGKFVLLGALCMTPLVVFSAPSLQQPSSVATDEAKVRPLSLRQFMVYVETPGRYYISILMERRIPSRKGMSPEEIHTWVMEEEKITSLISNIKGNISIYDEKQRKLLYVFDFESSKYIDDHFVFGHGYVGLGMVGNYFPIDKEGFYAIRSELYGGDAEYNDYMLTFSRVREMTK
ncbi:hypothetical protein HV213_23125 [Klebsiella sp. RHBSTW-00484]|uniref:hypothetical protein n=1 Tax=unclassified Klebsiella TaxID=2608929 RepID=UPI0015E55D60|nr:MULTISPECIES: hypothetical protein [unclassified Klebsiella]MBA7843128.1 hypothetical protein [Klebsiella sp. RHBSTW-00465]QLO38509.1 hypothetical protein HV213_23125 [Klebsiella sp. RHBSTW-00484]QLT78029.1 hypothetical protein HV204_23125 [Klebsiella sp. RHBSTW-00464]